MRMNVLWILVLLAACGGGGGMTRAQPISVPVAVDAGLVTAPLVPLWRDHYELSVSHLNDASEASFVSLTAALQPRSWRCSVGRWEVGTPAPAGETA